MTKPIYDATSDRWINNSGNKPVSVAAAVQRQNALKTTHPARGKRVPTSFSLVEWFIIGPMVVGLGFMIGVFWP